mmetsp:Transcript_5071/g.19007  ORF Transcript_5071/g.19007 Transcript_5071/m.19007 type:complete len:139 (+) Transcript_5071:724-1140(+)
MDGKLQERKFNFESSETSCWSFTSPLLSQQTKDSTHSSATTQMISLELVLERTQIEIHGKEIFRFLRVRLESFGDFCERQVDQRTLKKTRPAFFENHHSQLPTTLTKSSPPSIRCNYIPFPLLWIFFPFFSLLYFVTL